MIAYIWDLDGTLLDSYDVISSSAKEAAESAGVDDDIHKVLTMVKQTSVKVYMEDVSKRTGKTLDYIDCDKFWKLFKKAQKDAYNCGLEATKGE